VREAMLAGADLVDHVAFDGPVAATLRELQERWDGSGGPRGLAGESILLTARIVAVANTFVALASPRAHRAGLDLDAAARELSARAGSQFDRRPVTALINLLDNRGARQRWQWSATSPTA
jgi:HD-GYP domain-containing protein (c-di-GMP phosphodiesterase class II)